MTSTDSRRFRRVDLTEKITQTHAAKFLSWLAVYKQDIATAAVRDIDCAKILGCLLMIPSTSTLNLTGAVEFLDNSDGDDPFSFKLTLPFLIRGRAIPEELQEQLASSLFSLHLTLRRQASLLGQQDAMLVTRFFQLLADKLQVDRAAAGLGASEA